MNRKQNTTQKETMAPKSGNTGCGSCAQKKAGLDVTMSRISTIIRLAEYKDGHEDLELSIANQEKSVTISADVLRMLHLALELETTKACRLSGKNEALKKQLLRLGVEPEEPHPISDVIMPHYMDMDETMAMIGWKHYAGLPAMSVQAFLDRLLEEEKIYMGSHDFYAYLRREGYICKVDGNNVITEKAEYMRILENGGGKTPGGRGIRVTASGCDYFKDRLEELHEKMRRARPARETQD
ncbi:hypothetical protein [Eubacterium maltosivorans]|uniref:Antirepressor protein C-terminal domain-containing protein n=1 Tax=Eubacterium maltosivorans TaxID=2041044 RepID=A0A4P9C9R8_EUBML|nr:hypothetical protein [Eubacterium maltosivorans]QCT71432.1 hypothetical protein CPZ25_008845 [Eubacterium maltosivorans]